MFNYIKLFKSKIALIGHDYTDYRCYAYKTEPCFNANQYSKNQMNRKIHLKVIVKKVKNQHVYNGRMEILVTIIELIRFLNRT